MENGKDMRPDPVSSESPLEAREIDAVLSLGSTPPLPPDAASRLMARIAVEPQEHPQADVIPFRPRAHAPRRGLFRYAAALPLAASLALGVYLGAKGTLDFMLPTAITGVALNADAPDDLGGVGEADDYAAESLT